MVFEMRQQLFLPKVRYGDNDSFVFPFLANKLTRYPKNVVFNRWSSGSPMPWHGFVDDWRLESIWRDGSYQLGKFAQSGALVAVAPDFTVEHDYPLSVAYWQVYRSRLIAAAWQQAGVFTIPALQWSRLSISPVLFAGLEHCQVVAVRSPTKGFERAWCDCAKQFLEVNAPKLVLHFGTSRGLAVWGDAGRQMNLQNSRGSNVLVSR